MERGEPLLGADVVNVIEAFPLKPVKCLNFIIFDSRELRLDIAVCASEGRTKIKKLMIVGEMVRLQKVNSQ